MDSVRAFSYICRKVDARVQTCSNSDYGRKQVAGLYGEHCGRPWFNPGYAVPGIILTNKKQLEQL